MYNISDLTTFQNNIKNILIQDSINRSQSSTSAFIDIVYTASNLVLLGLINTLFLLLKRSSSRAILPKCKLIYAAIGKSGHKTSFNSIPSSFLIGSSSSRYCSYCVLFSTLALMPVDGNIVLAFVPLFEFWCFREALFCR